MLRGCFFCSIFILMSIFALMKVDYLENLNDGQRLAVETTEGAVRVIAGAGTGKTRALTARYCYLTDMLGISPRNILCATFTNRAAAEMKQRVRATLGDADTAFICTIHAFCVQLLKEDIHVLNFPKRFIILDTDDQKRLLLKIFDDMGITLREMTVQRALDVILEGQKLKADSYIRYFYQLDNEQLKQEFLNTEKRNDAIFLRYLYEQKKCYGCDFNDIINFAGYILDNFPEVRKKWQERMQYVMIDEFQDVSARQYAIARALAGKHGNLFIVGDPDQTIYTWRGSHASLFLDFPKIYPEAKTIVLDTNYRSTPEILRAADTLIAVNKTRYPKTLKPTKPDGPRPLFFHADNSREEAEWIAGKAASLIEDDGADPSEIAVLYRAHHLSRAVEEALIKKRIPYKIFSGTEFYGRREIKDIICYLRMLTDDPDDLAFLRTDNTPSRKIGKKKMDFLRAKAERYDTSLWRTFIANYDKPIFAGSGARRYFDAIAATRTEIHSTSIGNLLQSILDRSGYEEFLRLQGDQERLDNVAELKRAIAEADEEDDDVTLDDFLRRIALQTNLDRSDDTPRVKLMTIHVSKGMEFPYVFICGMNEGIFPSRKANTPEELEEERRLAYVAMTRAMDKLYLSDAEGTDDKGLYKQPSRFIFDAGADNLEFVRPLKDTTGNPGSAVAPLPEGVFAVGDHVKHPIFGEGIITAVIAKDSSYAILFDSCKTERNLRFAAPLIRVQ